MPRLSPGSGVRWGIFAQQRETEPGFGTSAVKPIRVVDLKLVGIIQYSTAVVQDDIDRYPTFVVFTSALGSAILAHDPQSVEAVTYGFQLRGGDAGVKPVETAFPNLLARGTSYDYHEYAPVEETVGTSLKPIAIALGVFGGIAALAVILIAMQIAGRQVQAAEADLESMRALGAQPVAIFADTMIGLLVAIAVGALRAGLVAVALSPFGPLGPVRTV